jgi:hypothetical protein
MPFAHIKTQGIGVEWVDNDIALTDPTEEGWIKRGSYPKRLAVRMKPGWKFYRMV